MLPFLVTKFNLELALIVLMIIVVQLFVTYVYTNTKRFSFLALFKNISIGIGIYLSVITKQFVWLIFPILVTLAIEYSKYNGSNFEKYIATEYQYSDYWREINKQNPIFSNLTEGIYDDVFGFDTKDHSEENVKNILEWSRAAFDNCHKNKTQEIVGINGVVYKDTMELKRIGEQNKFKTICERCKVDKDQRILEIGFGEGDFLIYIRDNYGNSPVGVSISEEQVKLAKSRGFEAHKLNMWDITPEKLGKFDLILQCGNVEYARCVGEPDDKYTDYFKIVQKLLKPDGKYFITCTHGRTYDYIDDYRLYDYSQAYFLLFGNDGAYPGGRFHLTTHAENANLKVVHQEERTNEYWITSVIFMSSYAYYSKTHAALLSFSGICDALIKTIADPYYIHTYICLTPNVYYDWNPWLWQFIPSQRKQYFGSPVTLEYILFENQP
jgi:cyclopropane fatty-acyl-phospholipid synthase-like methyltransferase